jgi:hypothetical protein
MEHRQVQCCPGRPKIPVPPLDLLALNLNSSGAADWAQAETSRIKSSIRTNGFFSFSLLKAKHDRKKCSRPLSGIVHILTAPGG